MDIEKENLALLVGANLVGMMLAKYQETKYDIYFKTHFLSSYKENIWLQVIAMKESRRPYVIKDVIDDLNRKEILESLRSFFEQSLRDEEFNQIFSKYEINIKINEEDLCDPKWRDLYRKIKYYNLYIPDLLTILTNEKKVKNIKQYQTIFPYIDFEKDRKSRELISYSLLKETLPVNSTETNKPKI